MIVDRLKLLKLRRARRLALNAAKTWRRQPRKWWRENPRHVEEPVDAQSEGRNQ